MRQVWQPVVGLGLLLASCAPAIDNSVGPADEAATTGNATPAVAAQAAPPREPVAAASTTKVKTDDYSFSYSYPAVAASIAPLRQWLDSDREKARASLAKDAAEFRREAMRDGFPFRAYDMTTDWKVVTETPRFLSLSSEFYVYTGGAHGSPGFETLLWDKPAGTQVEPTALFTSAAAIQEALGEAFCQRLDAERTKRRGEPVVRSDDDPFNACPKVSEATLILGSTDRRAFDRIGLLVGPYVAGPYAEGTFDLTLPVTPAVLAAVKPEYRDAFAR